MNPIVFASLSVLVIFGQTVVAVGYTRKCKSNTEPCLNLKCEATQDPISVPFRLHYACCKGHLFDQEKYACVRLHFYSIYIKTVLVKCDNCTQFTCGDGQCTMKQWKCNNLKDCIDGTDEVGCGPCGKDEFYCRNADQCISAARVCDKSIDCKDGSDELNCPNTDGSLCGGVDTFRCSSSKCIHWNNVCNGVNDCDDNSDEGGNCDRDTGKRDEISTFSEDGGVGGNGVDASTGTVVS